MDKTRHNPSVSTGGGRPPDPCTHRPRKLDPAQAGVSVIGDVALREWQAAARPIIFSSMASMAKVILRRVQIMRFAPGLVWGVLFFVWADAGGTAPVLTVHSGPPPVIDGRLNDVCWSSASRITRFMLLGRKGAPTQSTEVRLACDARRLCAAFICREDAMNRVRAEVQTRDGPVYEDDCVEIFISPTPSGIPYRHFLVNAGGVMRDEIGQDVSWNVDWQAAVRRFDDRWTVEIAIPFDALGIPADVPDVWRLNFTREERPHGELSTWQPCEDSFHEPQHFGRVRITGVDFAPYARRALLREAARLKRRFADLAARLGKRPDDGAPRLAARIRQRFEEGRQEFSKLQRRLKSMKSAGVEDLRAAARLAATCKAELSVLERLAGRLLMARALGLPNADFLVCRESTMVKVRPDVPYHGTPVRNTDLYMARNEYESLQLVIVPLDSDLKRVRVTASSFHGPGGAVLDSRHIQVRPVGWVKVTTPSGKARMGVGRFPDPLLPDGPFDVAADEVRPVWITFYAPPDAPAGVYRGNIQISGDGTAPYTVDVNVHVWNFALPRSSFLRTDFAINPSYVARAHGASAVSGVPAGWIFGTWVGADVKGRANYFGSGSFGIESDTSSPHSPPRAVHLSGRAVQKGTHEWPRACLYTEPIPLEKGAEYELSLWYRSRSRAKARRVAGLYFPPFGSAALPDAEGWTRWSRRFRTTGPVSMRVYLGCYAEGDVWFDDVSLRRVDPPDPHELLPSPGFDEEPPLTLDELLRAYRLDALRHRVCDQNVASPKIKLDANSGRVEIDWTGFDRDLQFYLDHGQNAFNVHWARLPHGWGKVQTVSEDQRRTAAAILRRTQAHLDARGWTDLAYVYVIDEPSAKFFPQVREAFQIVRTAAPRLKTLLTFGYGATRPWRPGRTDVEAAYAALTDVVDIFVPHIDCADWRVLERVRGRDNNEIWEYVCISAQHPYPNIWAVDYPGVEHRVVYWQLYRYGFQGFLYWNMTYWKKNPWTDPMTYPGGNGDGSLLYPGKNGPVDSIRLEITRDGIEDYDMLHLLERAAKQCRDEQARRRASAMLDVTDIARTLTEYTTDSDKIERRRLEAGNLLDQLSRMESRIP